MSDYVYLKNGETIHGSNGPFLKSYYMVSSQGPGIVELNCLRCINGKMTYYPDLSAVESSLPSEQGWLYQVAEPFDYGIYEIKYITMCKVEQPGGFMEAEICLRDESRSRLCRHYGVLVNGTDGINGIRYGAVSGSHGYDLLSPTPLSPDPDPGTDPDVEDTTESPRHEVLRQVETIDITPSGNIVEQDGSDSKATLNTINSESLHIGSLAPGETSETKIIRLKVPSSIGIENIKIGLINTGGIGFEDNIFGVETLNYLDYNFVPSKFFQGVNSHKKSTSSYNIDIPNDGFQKSQYVYLNMRLPSNHGMGGGTIRYKWFFDYESGVSATDLIDGGDTSGSDDGIGSDPSEPFEFPSIIISGSNNPGINGTYEIGRILSETNDVGNLHVQYFKENLGEPSPEDYNNGHVMILYLYLDNNHLSFGKITSAPRPWHPDGSPPTISELWTYSLSLDQVSEWNDIDGKILENTDYSGTGDSSPLFPSDPYPNDALMLTIV